MAKTVSNRNFKHPFGGPHCRKERPSNNNTKIPIIPINKTNNT